jgi:DNA-binding CsgD family transcriptional regulator
MTTHSSRRGCHLSSQRPSFPKGRSLNQRLRGTPRALSFPTDERGGWRYRVAGQADVDRCDELGGGRAQAIQAESDESRFKEELLRRWRVRSPRVSEPIRLRRPTARLINSKLPADGSLEGNTFITPSVAGEIQKPRKADPSVKPAAALTGRQREVLQLLAEGKTAKEIAGVLDISTRTVEFHKYEMMQSLSIRERRQNDHPTAADTPKSLPVWFVCGALL